MNNRPLPPDTYHVLRKIRDKKEKNYGFLSLLSSFRLAFRTVMLVLSRCVGLCIEGRVGGTKERQVGREWENKRKENERMKDRRKGVTEKQKETEKEK